MHVTVSDPPSEDELAEQPQHFDQGLAGMTTHDLGAAFGRAVALSGRWQLGQLAEILHCALAAVVAPIEPLDDVRHRTINQPDQRRWWHLDVRERRQTLGQPFVLR